MRNRAPGAAAQPAPSSREIATASSGTGTHVEPGPSVRVETAAGQGVAQPRPAVGVVPLGVGDQLGCRAVGPQADGQPLQQVADPARPEPQAAMHALDGPVVTGQHGHAQVRAVGLGRRADERPVGGAAGQGAQRYAGDARAVIVLDHQQVLGAARQHLTQDLGALRR